MCVFVCYTCYQCYLCCRVSVVIDDKKTRDKTPASALMGLELSYMVSHNVLMSLSHSAHIQYSVVQVYELWQIDTCLCVIDTCLCVIDTCICAIDTCLCGIDTCLYIISTFFGVFVFMRC